MWITTESVGICNAGCDLPLHSGYSADVFIQSKKQIETYRRYNSKSEVNRISVVRFKEWSVVTQSAK